MVLTMAKVAWSSRKGSGDGGVNGGGEFGTFCALRTLFNVDNTIFSLTSGGSCYSREAQTGAGVRGVGVSPHAPPPSF